MKLRRKKVKAPIMEYPYVWNRAYRPAGRLGQKCKRLGWKDKSQGLVIIEFTDGQKFIVQRTGLQLRTPVQDG